MYFEIFASDLDFIKQMQWRLSKKGLWKPIHCTTLYSTTYNLKLENKNELLQNWGTYCTTLNANLMSITSSSVQLSWAGLESDLKNNFIGHTGLIHLSYIIRYFQVSSKELLMLNL